LLIALSSYGFAQSLTFGLYGRSGPDYLTPTIEANYPVGDTTLGLRAQRDAFGISAESALELGPAGRVSYGARGNVGFAGWGLEGFVRGGVAQVALEGYLAYSTTPRNTLWVGDNYSKGLAISTLGSAQNLGGGLSGRYRLSSKDTLGLALEYANLWAAEGTYALRENATYTFGLGFQNGLYGLLGWRGELDEAGTLLEATLRAGGFNRLESALTIPLGDEEISNLKLRLTLAYPLAATLSVEMNDLRLDTAYEGGFSAWLRYRINFGGE